MDANVAPAGSHLYRHERRRKGLLVAANFPTLTMDDDDIDADDMIGQGNRTIPSNACRLGSASIDVRETPCG